jgi:hypothetical protein
MHILSLFLATVAPLSSVAETSGFQRTGRYDEVERLCDAFAASSPRVHCTTFGTTPQGRAMKALVVDEAVHQPTILVQGGIHAGEIDGKDAGFAVVRAILAGKPLPFTFVFVPVFNVDGHERFGASNRPNQRGPIEMGWRTTAQNLNLNRDYMKADAPEMRAMLSLLAKFDPVLYVDLHVTDGAQFQHDVSITVDPALQSGPLADQARALQSNVVKRVNAKGHHALDFYPSFVKDDDPASGFAAGIAPPRFSTPYWALHGHMGMLVETHSWKDYKTRVTTTIDVLDAVLAEASAHAEEWAKLTVELPKQIVLAWENTDEKKTIDFLGYEYTRVPSAASGTLRTIYDEKKPAIWKVPLLPSVKPALVVDAPAGWVVPVEWVAIVKPRLDAHAIESKPIDGDRDVDVFRATEVKLGDGSYEGHQTARVKGTWSREKRSIAKGSLFVPYAQPRGLVAANLLEPQGPDSLLSWGFMNAVFEQKEYMEPYVAEDVAAKMLKDPKVAAEFNAKLDDPAFAKDPEKRLQFFYRKHPSWDERKDLVPVFRLMSPP